jgi:PAS domain S-box-containing protein
MPVKMWRGWSSVQTRVTALMLTMALLAVFGLVMSQLSETRRTDAQLAADAKEHGDLLDRTIELEGGSLAVFAKDYTNWTEMVQFVQTGDRTWASVNIDDVLTTYRANAAWIFDTAGRLLYAVRDSTLEALLEPLPPGLSVKDAFRDGHFCHFFIEGPDGPVEMQGATIHPSNDTERETPVRGYFLVARLWNGQYLAELARVTGKTMGIEPAGAEAKPSAKIARQSGEITFTRPLPGPRGKAEMALTASLRPGWVVAAQRSGRGLFVQQLVLALLGVLSLTLVLWFWVTRPLGRIRRSLESGSTEALKPLEHNRTEFGQLAQLVGQFFGQNKALVKEVTEHRQSVEALRATEERYRHMVELSPAGILAVDLKGTVTSANEAFVLLSGFPTGELVGRHITKLPTLVGQDMGTYVDLFNRIIKGKLTAPTEFKWRHADGSPRDGEGTVSLLRDNQHVTGAQILVTDITERKRAEAELAAQAERTRILFEYAPDAYYLSDFHGTFLDGNRAAEQMLGYQRDELIGASFLKLNLLPASELAKAAGLLVRNALGKATGPDELILRRKDGTLLSVEVYTHVVTIHGRKVVLGSARDITERKRTEAALRENEEKYRLVVDNAGEAILVAQDGKLVFTNPRTSEMIGHSREELLGRSFIEFVHPDDRALVADNYRKRIAGESLPDRYEFRIVGRDGKTRHVEINAVRIDWLGRPATLNFLADVTERRRAEAALVESELTYRRVFENSNDAMVLFESGKFLDCNEAALRTFGYSTRDEFLGKDVGAISPPLQPDGRESRSAIGEHTETAFRDGRDFFEWVQQRPDGTVFPVDVLLTPLDYHGQKILQATVRDISERKQAEAALRESEEKYRLVVDNANEAILVAQDGKMVFTNPRMSEMMGYTREELVARPLFEFVHPDDRTLVADRYRRRAAGEDVPNRYEFRIVGRDGETHNLEINAVCINWLGRPATINFLADITERRRAEDALRESEERHRLLFETMGQGVVYQDADGRIVSANPAAERILGLTIDQMQGRTSADPRWHAIREDGSDFPGETHASMIALRTGKEVSGVIMGVFNPTADSYHWISIDAVPQFRPGEDRPYRVYATFTDITERRRTEEEITQAGLRLEHLLKSSPVVIYTAAGTADSGATFVSGNVLALVGFEPSDFLNDPGFWRNHVHPEDRDRVMAELPQMFRQPSFAHEYRFRNKIGDYIWVHDEVKVLRDARGEPVEVIGSWSDVTERRRAEEALRTSEAQLSNAMEIAHLGYWEYDVDDDMFTFNDHFYSIFRTSAEKVGGYKMASAAYAGRFVHPDDMALVGAETRKAIESTDPHFSRQLEHRVIRADGSVGHISVRFFIIKDSQGRTVKTFGANQDITERKQAEEDLNLKAELLDSSTDSIFLHDPAGRFLYANESSYKTRGYTKEEFLALNLHDINVPEYAARIEARVAGLQRTGEATFESAEYRRDRSVMPVEVHARMLEVGGRKLILSVVRDITDRKKTDTEIAQKTIQLLELNDVKNQLLGMAAHDLRNPLSVVSTASAFLLDDAGRLLPEAKRTDFLRRINSSSEFMLRMIDDLLDVAKIEAGKLDLELADGDLCGLLEENLSLNRMLAEKKGIRLNFAPECSVPPFRFDRGKVEQVLNNLISNALKFSAPGTAVMVQASRVNDTVVVSVRDQGPGIPAEELDRLFKPFSMTSVRGTAGEKSTGLGLAICRKIIEGHRGRIWAESEVGKGSVFSFSLPVNDENKS